MSSINQNAVHETINKGSWYDLKPGETAATTSSLGPGIIEINKDAVAPPPIPDEGSIPFPEEAPPPLPPIDGPEPIPLQNTTRQVDRSSNPFEFLEVPEEEMEDSLGLKALRIIVAAAHADGSLHEKEREMLETHLKDLGPEERELAKSELSHPLPMNEIVAGIDSLEDRKFIFGLAAMTLRADNKITPEENQFIRDLAKQLRLDKTTAMEIIKASKQ
ncbi:MAG: tellurite resistance TerB family protein [Nitrospinota bacterium]|nr:tellurite resistance TerB family protein [Nitrospinota bacterium]